LKQVAITDPDRASAPDHVGAALGHAVERVRTVYVSARTDVAHDIDRLLRAEASRSFSRSRGRAEARMRMRSTVRLVEHLGPVSLPGCGALSRRVVVGAL